MMSLSFPSIIIMSGMVLYIIYIHYFDQMGRKRNTPIAKSYFLPKSEERFLAWLDHHVKLGLMRHQRLAHLLYGQEEFEVRINREQCFGEKRGFHPVGWFIVNFRKGQIYVKKKYSGVKAIPGLPERMQPFFKRPDKPLFDRGHEKHIVSFGPESTCFKRHGGFFDETREDKERRTFINMRFRRGFF